MYHVTVLKAPGSFGSEGPSTGHQTFFKESSLRNVAGNFLVKTLVFELHSSQPPTIVIVAAPEGCMVGQPHIAGEVSGDSQDGCKFFMLTVVCN